MKRNTARLSSKEYDLVIIGGGIYGICIAWDAALRGLSVALMDRGDFCSATSANSLKIVHGGFRYLQHADFRRMRDSINERRVLMRIAPHLVYPIPFLIPTYGRGIQGKEILTLALSLYNLVAFDRNRGLQDPQRHIPWGNVISKEECLQLFPTLEREGLTGGVIFYDGQMYSPPRLAFSYLKSAVSAGADAVNYLEAVGFLQDRSRVTGVTAKDVLTGDGLDIRGKVVVNATGPWAEHLLGHLDIRLRPPLLFTKDLYLVASLVLSKKYALAVPSRQRDHTAVASRGGRHFFLIPWRDRTLIGSSHLLYQGTPEEFVVTPQDLQMLIDEVNGSCPALGLKLSDISMWNGGFVPFGDHYGRRSQVIDHARHHGMHGLVTVTGVRYTTSRGVAAKTVDLVFHKLGRKTARSVTEETPIYGGRIERFDEFLRGANDQRPAALDVEVMRALLHNHGSEYRGVLKYLDEDGAWAERVGASTVIKAEVIHAVHEEMAQNLADVVFRRTDLGTAGNPGESALRTCAAVMAAELKWDETRVEKELAEVMKVFQ